MVEMAEWTDKRLDDLAKNVDSRFEQVDTRLRELRADFDRRFDQAESVTRELRGEMNERFNAVDARFDAMQRTLIIGLAGIVASICGSTAAAIIASNL